MLNLADALTEHIVLHPFVALRRTCQVNRRCSPFICIQPFSLVPFMYHQQREQGIFALYKGLSSELLVKGMTMGAQTAIANYAEWPTEVNPKRLVQDSVKVLALRGISVALSTPFLCSSLVETVQSVIVVKDRPSFIDCLRDGFTRLFHLRLTPTSRMMPIWLIIVPTVLYHVTHTALKNVTQKIIELVRGHYTSRCRTRHQSRYRSNIQSSIIDESLWQPEDTTNNLEESSFEQDSCELHDRGISDIILSSFLADVALLPFETVLHSLYVQGTRTIIDNCDETTVVLPVLTNYDGFNDCYQSIMRFEGTFGLYKGLGAIMLQYTLHFVIFRIVYYLMKEFLPNNRGNPNNSLRQNRRGITRPKSDYFSRLHTNQLHSTPYSETLEALETRPPRTTIDGTPKRFD